MNNKCDCENHYLELKSFDIQSNAFIYQRMCYKCGKWWTYSNNSMPLKNATLKFSFCSLKDLHENRVQHAEIGQIFFVYETLKLVIKTVNGFEYIT